LIQAPLDSLYIAGGGLGGIGMHFENHSELLTIP